MSVGIFYQLLEGISIMRADNNETGEFISKHGSFWLVHGPDCNQIDNLSRFIGSKGSSNKRAATYRGKKCWPEKNELHQNRTENDTFLSLMCWLQVQHNLYRSLDMILFQSNSISKQNTISI